MPRHSDSFLFKDARWSRLSRDFPRNQEDYKWIELLLEEELVHYVKFWQLILLAFATSQDKLLTDREIHRFIQDNTENEVPLCDIRNWLRKYNERHPLVKIVATTAPGTGLWPTPKDIAEEETICRLDDKGEDYLSAPFMKQLLELFYLHHPRVDPLPGRYVRPARCLWHNMLLDDSAPQPQSDKWIGRLLREQLIDGTNFLELIILAITTQPIIIATQPDRSGNRFMTRSGTEQDMTDREIHQFIVEHYSDEVSLNYVQKLLHYYVEFDEDGVQSPRQEEYEHRPWLTKRKSPINDKGGADWLWMLGAVPRCKMVTSIPFGRLYNLYFSHPHLHGPIHPNTLLRYNSSSETRRRETSRIGTVTPSSTRKASRRTRKACDCSYCVEPWPVRRSRKLSPCSSKLELRRKQMDSSSQQPAGPSQTSNPSIHFGQQPSGPSNPNIHFVQLPSGSSVGVQFMGYVAGPTLPAYPSQPIPAYHIQQFPGPSNPNLNLGQQIYGPSSPNLNFSQQLSGPSNPNLNFGQQLSGPSNPNLNFGQQIYGPSNSNPHFGYQRPGPVIASFSQVIASGVVTPRSLQNASSGTITVSSSQPSAGTSQQVVVAPRSVQNAATGIQAGSSSHQPAVNSQQGLVTPTSGSGTALDNWSEFDDTLTDLE